MIFACEKWGELELNPPNNSTTPSRHVTGNLNGNLPTIPTFRQLKCDRAAFEQSADPRHPSPATRHPGHDPASSPAGKVAMPRRWQRGEVSPADLSFRPGRDSDMPFVSQQGRYSFRQNEEGKLREDVTGLVSLSATAAAGPICGNCAVYFGMSFYDAHAASLGIFTCEMLL